MLYTKLLYKCHFCVKKILYSKHITGEVSNLPSWNLAFKLTGLMFCFVILLRTISHAVKLYLMISVERAGIEKQF